MLSLCDFLALQAYVFRMHNQTSRIESKVVDMQAEGKFLIVLILSYLSKLSKYPVQGIHKGSFFSELNPPCITPCRNRDLEPKRMGGSSMELTRFPTPSLSS